MPAPQPQPPQNQAPFTPGPGGMVTLDTVNLDENKADDCEPEIKVLTSSSDGEVKNAAAKQRQRGSSTRLATLKSYRVKFDKGADRQGEDTLNLNKHPYDLTCVRNKLAFDLMRQVPYHQSLRTQFVEIRYDAGAGAGTGAGAQPMGLFTHIEKLGGKSYLERRGWVAGSNVYKVAAFNFSEDAKLRTLADDKAGAGFEELLEIESDSGNHGAIVQAVKALADDDTPFATTFNRHFDRNNYLAWLASAILLGNWDTVNQNFGLYQPLGGERFYFLPWDYDGALGYPQQPGAALYPQWNRGISAWWDSSLHRRFLTEPGNLALLQAAVEEIRNKHLTDAAVKQLLDGYRPIVEPILARAPDVGNLDAKGSGTPMQQWAAEYQRLQTVIGQNRGFFLESLQRPMPYWLAASDKAGLELDWGWPAPFHPQGKPISYQVQVARAVAGQPAFADGTLVLQPAPVSGRTLLNVGALPAGQYLVRVTASDADGNRSNAFDSTSFDGQTVDGAICLNMPGATPC